VQNLEQSVQRLSQYTEDLLVIGSIEAGDTSDLKSVTLHEVLDPLVQQTQSLAKAKKLKFTTTIEPPETLELRANPRRLQSALWNLLDNAIKFTAKGSVELAVTKQDKQVAITVSDTGIGIAPEEIPQLFTRFHRGTSILEYNYEGEGIGLALAKLVITEHGGTISVISKLDSGTTFTVTLPLL
jgi:signal transduction histidine kinase